MNMRWEIKSEKKVKNEEQVVEVLLANRGIKSSRQINEFLNPPLPQNYSLKKLGMNLGQVKLAEERVRQAVERGEEILIYGDYDADGICATAILWESVNALGAKVLPYIPDRFGDGYGLNAKSVKKLKGKHPGLSLIITVDNGIVAFEGAKIARSMGIDLIITDHHSAKEELPEACSIIHTTLISGSAVAWVFAQQLSPRDDHTELAAIGTISDQLPLDGFNRALVKHGLLSLSKTKRLGLLKLFATAGLLEKQIGSYEVNFMIAPRINASGRMADGMDALRLLCTKDGKRASTLANTLERLNGQRQDAVEQALSFSDGDYQESSIIVVWHDSFHEGIIGLIASRLTEKYYKPSIVISLGKNFAKASARSISGFNIIEAIRAHEELIVEGGGHEMAAGFTIKSREVGIFSEKINEYAKSKLQGNLFEKKLSIDLNLPFKFIGAKLYNMLSGFEPHGIGNPAPLFVTNDVNIVSQKLVGKNNDHLKLSVKKNGIIIDAMMFKKSDYIDKDKINIAYKLSENVWNGSRKIELVIRDAYYG